jgi:hypothetical protein
MAEEQRKKRAQHRAQLKQLKAQAAATAAAAAAAATAKAVAAKAAAAAALKNPAHWETVDRAHGNKHLVRLTTKHRAELTAVKRHWKSTNGLGRVISVHRIQNGALHRRFEKMRKSHPKLAEKVAYHGTRANVPASIYDSPSGFDMSRGAYAPGSVKAHTNLKSQAVSAAG